MYENFRFKHPFTCIIAGPTGCGKTNFLSKIISTNSSISPYPDKIYYCYSEWQKAYDLIKLSNHSIEFINGLIDPEIIIGSRKNLVIIDDLMNECLDSETIFNFFTKWSHHRNTSVIFVTQNIFNQGKYSRAISLNAHYLVIFNNPRDRQQIKYLGQQMFPGKSKYLIESYSDACTKPYGYILIDLKQDTPDILRIQTGIFSDEDNIVYVSKK